MSRSVVSSSSLSLVDSELIWINLTIGSLHLRQRLIERIFEGNLEEVAGEGVYGGYELEGFVDESLGGAAGAVQGQGGYPVKAEVRNGLTGEVSMINA